MASASSNSDLRADVWMPASFSIAANCAAAIDRAASTLVLLAAVICSGVTYMVDSSVGWVSVFLLQSGSMFCDCFVRRNN